MLRIGMLTSGGDCQALNAAMRGVVKGICNKRKDVEIYGFKDGYKGLIYSDFNMLTSRDFSGILTQGGTILGTSRQPFKLMRVPDKDGIDKVEAMKHTYHKLHLDCLVVLGGIQRIAKVSEIVVPFMAVLYVVLAVIIMVTNITAIPAAIVTIVKSAFTGSALAGGAMGSMIVAMQKGIARGIFSNEAGLGTGSIAHACADTKKPVKQGMFGIFEVFTDTIVICTLTALVILCSGTSITYGQAAGAELTISGFTLTYGNWVSLLTAFAMCCFAFSTILGWGLYGARCIEFLFSERITKYFMAAYALVAILGATANLGLMWSIAETFNGLMAIPNLIALFLLSGKVVELTKEYFCGEGKTR